MVAFFTMANGIQSENEKATSIKNINDLEQLLRKEITTIPNGDCEGYADYYKQLISLKYPELDVKKVEYLDVCGIGFPDKPLNNSLCNDYHTLLVIGGKCSVCMLDQRKLLCEELKCD